MAAGGRCRVPLLGALMELLVHNTLFDFKKKLIGWLKKFSMHHCIVEALTGWLSAVLLP